MPENTNAILRDERGFTLPEMLISTLLLLIVTGVALGTFHVALITTDGGSQLADANQNLRAGTNQLVKDLMQAGRIIGPTGVPVPTGVGASAIKRPGPPGSNMTFDMTGLTNLPDITTGNSAGPMVNGQATDIVTILTVDAFMPNVELDPAVPAQGSIASAGDSVTLPAGAAWMIGDTTNDTPALRVGDIVLFKNVNGSAVQTVTRVDTTHIYFDTNDSFRLNQRTAPQGTIMQIDASNQRTTMFRLLMTTYYVDAVTTPAAPRLVRQVNNFTPQALAGIVEELQFSYDLVDGVRNPTQVPQLPFVDTTVNPSVTFNANQIRAVNVLAGVRSESFSRPNADFVRNRVETAVDVRSMASVDRYESE